MTPQPHPRVVALVTAFLIQTRSDGKQREIAEVARLTGLCEPAVKRIIEFIEGREEVKVDPQYIPGRSR